MIDGVLKHIHIHISGKDQGWVGVNKRYRADFPPRLNQHPSEAYHGILCHKAITFKCWFSYKFHRLKLIVTNTI